MLAFATRRFLALVPILLGVAVVTFTLLLLIPGDPVDTLLPPDAPPEAREAYRQRLNLDEPVHKRFSAWLTHAARGDLGQSIQLRQPARDVTLRALKHTLELALAGFLIALLLGVGAGIAMGWWSDRLVSRVLNVAVVGAVSMPQFWLGLVLLYFFALTLNIFPTGGIGPVTGERDFFTRIQYVALPAVTVAVLPMAIIARLSRSLFLELKQQDFVVTLRTRGYSTLRIWRHLLRNAAPGVVNIGGLQAGYAILGTLFAEVVFSWPGIGIAVTRAIESRDYPVIQAIILVTGVLFATITVVVDLVMRALDPRTEID